MENRTLGEQYSLQEEPGMASQHTQVGHPSHPHQLKGKILLLQYDIVSTFTPKRIIYRLGFFCCHTESTEGNLKMMNQ
jgi:coenzyme F420-reducing hydrogenase beta subunit